MLKFNVPILVLLLITSSLSAQWKMDKLDNNSIVHFSVGIGIGNISSTLGKTPKQRILIAAISGTAIGISKELYDQKRGGQYGQVNDVLTTAAGSVVGALIVNYAVRRTRNTSPKEKKERCRM